MRIVTCSNSSARVSEVDGAPDLVPVGPGGVVPMVAALLRRFGGDWFSIGDHRPASVTIDGVTTRLHPVRLDPATAEAHHGRIAIQVLQWIFHYLHETSASPLFDRGTWTAWRAYAEVNAMVAGRMAAAARDDGQRVWLVNDHQFLLVPEHLRAAVPAAHLVYFHQLPWCQADYFGMLPRPVRDAILRNLLACDVVGFHARRWADAFLDCCARFLPGVDVRGDRVTTAAGSVRVVVAPGPVDESALARVAADRRTDRWRETLSRQLDGRRLLVRAERFDLWKNVRRGLLAYEELLARRPEVADEVWFCALLSPPRRATARHRAERAACEAVADRVNARRRRAVTLLYPRPGDNGPHRVAAALGLAAATLVNPTFDGLNLVAMESLLLAPRTPVILSRNAGAYEFLGRHTATVDPFDVTGTADAIGAALDGPPPQPVAAHVANPTRDAETWLAALR